jgi:hypothetical protein
MSCQGHHLELAYKNHLDDKILVHTTQSTALNNRYMDEFGALWKVTKLCSCNVQRAELSTSDGGGCVLVLNLFVPAGLVSLLLLLSRYIPVLKHHAIIE